MSSITQSELLGIATALSQVKRGTSNIIIVSDSLSALQSLLSKSPVCATLTNRILNLIRKFSKKQRTVNFIWAPSHCNIAGNDHADELAKQGALKDSVDYVFPLSKSHLKTVAGESVQSIYREYLEAMKASHQSFHKYFSVSGVAPPAYVSLGLVTRRQQTTFSRLRLQYRYMWEVSGAKVNKQKDCRLCGQAAGHTLNHYIAQCNKLITYRTACNSQSIPDLLSLFLRPVVLIDIFKRYPLFASAS